MGNGTTDTNTSNSDEKAFAENVGIVIAAILWCILLAIGVWGLLHNKWLGIVLVLFLFSQLAFLLVLLGQTIAKTLIRFWPVARPFTLFLGRIGVLTQIRKAISDWKTGRAIRLTSEETTRKEMAAREEEARKDAERKAREEDARWHREQSERQPRDEEWRRQQEQQRREQNARINRRMRKGAKEYAEILGVSPSVSIDVIRKRYRELAVQYHPDVMAGFGPELREIAEQEMKDINEAYAYFKG